jgi:hypothetical protein
MKRRDHMEDQHVNERIILKLSLEKQMGTSLSAAAGSSM